MATEAKIKPSLDEQETSRMNKKMENSMKSSFKNVASSWKTIVGTAMLGTVLAVGKKLMGAGADSAKVVIDEGQKMVSRFSLIKDLATGYGASNRQMMRFLQLGKVSGLEDSQMIDALNKFQAKRFDDVSKGKGTLAQFKEGSALEAFINFQRSISGLKDTEKRNAFLTDVFGTGQLGRMNTFFTKDLEQISRDLGKIPSSFEKSISDSERVEEKNSIDEIRREQTAFASLADRIRTINATDQELKKIENDRLIESISKFDSLREALIAREKIGSKIEQATETIAENVIKISNGLGQFFQRSSNESMDNKTNSIVKNAQSRGFYTKGKI